ncbi:hypothetical protein [uncultured Hymenobacter sp.]|uniref:hypothetical protein n=1 Tax=uncultured Hymenobacter sp. TaxID=170016 RepID=UPI0035C94CC7
MFKHFTRLVAVGSILVVTGCAGSYRAIQPDRIATYQSTATASPVEFSYQYSALIARGGNKKYLKKERKRGYQVVAVKVKNNTGADLLFGRDLELSFGDRPIVPVPAVQAANDLKQGVAIYLLYVLGIGQIGGTTDPFTGQTTGGTLFPWGPFVAAGNMIGAGTANANLRKEFVQYDMANKVIRAGETVFGIVSLREGNVAPLNLSLRNQGAATSTPAQPVQQPAPQAPASSPAPAGSGR